MSLWTAQTAMEATGGTCAVDWTARGVSIDTRTLQKGDLFVALTDMRDGHEFVAAALAKGAAAALVSRIPDGVSADAPLLIVPDVLTGLETLGQAARARSHARIVAVTGSVGKTSTKEMLRAALYGQGRVHAAEASYNNQWGVPLTLARMPADSDYAIFEIGMNHPGEIGPLAAMVRPHVAMITTIAAAHLEAFAGLDAIAEEKAAIFGALEPGGVAVINGDLAQTPILVAAAKAAGAKVISFGTGAGNHHRLSEIVVKDGVTVAAGRAWRRSFMLKVATEGQHFAVNALGALACATALGADMGQALGGLAGWTPPRGRGHREDINLRQRNAGTGGPVQGAQEAVLALIDDAFNANPTSLKAALNMLAVTQPPGLAEAKGRRVAVLGDMLELGPHEAALHLQFANEPSLAQVDIIHCVGLLMRGLYDQLPAHQRGKWAATAQELLPNAARLAQAGDIILIKGSKGSKVSLIVDAIRKLGHRNDPRDQEN